ncbi:FAD:protein FMN transferase [Chitinophaga sp. MM2321]|uniref:FAD:protein FMN transferase n=1 Tax=Chitinophaga sp. MM2321 TaxID=3137178 RepID=UPI0032D574E0
MKILTLLLGFFSILSTSGLAVAATRDLPVISLEGVTQGTTYHIRYLDGQQRNFKQLVDSVLMDIDKCLSTYRTDSEISLFNQSDQYEFQLPYFYPVLKKSAEVYVATQGAFDPTVMPLVAAYRAAKKTGKLTSPRRVDSLLQYVGFHLISFDEFSVRKLNTNVRLDFDAIAQGYTVDVMAALLESKGITSYMVEVGGELRSKGKKSDHAYWTIGIENPFHSDGLQSVMRLVDKAAATSGNYRNYYKQNGHTYSHIIDPRTGYSRQDPLQSATVFANDAMTADAYATAFLVMGLEATKQFLSGRHDLDAYLIYADDKGTLKTYATAGIKNDVVPGR